MIGRFVDGGPGTVGGGVGEGVLVEERGLGAGGGGGVGERGWVWRGGMLIIFGSKIALIPPFLYQSHSHAPPIEPHSRFSHTHCHKQANGNPQKVTFNQQGIHTISVEYNAR
jgi:hypothetical protein